MLHNRAQQQKIFITNEFLCVRPEYKPYMYCFCLLASYFSPTYALPHFQQPILFTNKKNTKQNWKYEKKNRNLLVSNEKFFLLTVMLSFVYNKCLLP